MDSIPSSGGSAVVRTPPAASGPAPAIVATATASGIIVCVAGGFATGFMLTKHPVFGVALAGVGAVAGFVSRKITGVASRTAGRLIVAGCVVAFCLAMLSWYRWNFTIPGENGERRDPTWAESVARAPKLLLQFQHPITFLVSALSAAFGATEAMRQAGRRFRLVAIEEE